MNTNNIAFEEFIVELTLWYLMADDLVREDAALREKFSCQVELMTFAQWQAQRILGQHNSEEQISCSRVR